MSSAEILWALYQEHCTWERHHEEQRATATNILIAVAAGILSIMSLNGIAKSDLPLAFFLITQGLFGAVFVAKQYERFARHQNLAKKYREALDKEFADAHIIQLREIGDDEHQRHYGSLSRLRLNWFWISLHLVIAAFGCVLAGIILFS